MNEISKIDVMTKTRKLTATYEKEPPPLKLFILNDKRPTSLQIEFANTGRVPNRYTKSQRQKLKKILNRQWDWDFFRTGDGFEITTKEEVQKQYDAIRENFEDEIRKEVDSRLLST